MDEFNINNFETKEQVAQYFLKKQMDYYKSQLKDLELKLLLDKQQYEIFGVSACKNCNNNPINGGSGVCHCILRTPQITC